MNRFNFKWFHQCSCSMLVAVWFFLLLLFSRVHHAKLPTDKLSRINTNLTHLFDAFFVCAGFCSLFHCCRPVNTMEIYSSCHTTRLHCSHRHTAEKTNNHHHIEVPNGNNNRNNNNTQQKIYFLYFDVPFFCHFFSFNFHRVISGSFQFEFLAGNLHEYNDFWASTKRDNILKSRNIHNALTEKEREWIHQWIVRMFGVCVDGSYHKPISLFHFFLSRKIWTHCQRNLFDWFRYLTTRFDCE